MCKALDELSHKPLKIASGIDSFRQISLVQWV